MSTIFGRGSAWTVSGIFLIAIVIAGCGDDAAEDSAAADSDNKGKNQRTAESPNAGKKSFRMLEFDDDSAGGSGPITTLAAHQRERAVRAKLRPLAVVIGKWQGLNRQQPGQPDEVNWVWDFQTDETQPALVMTTKTSPYIERARLTYLVDRAKYQLTTVDKEGMELEYVGEFSIEPHDVPDSDGKTVHRSFKLELTRESAEPKHKLVKVVLNQQENNRYLLELYTRNNRRYETVANQRKGTSFAVSEDYGEKECIISQGLGTKTIVYKDKTYWVCCSGCEAAFKDDPERWIAKAAQRKKMEK